jgi:hypothetical protein
MNDAPDLTPVIACERTASGWRGLTEDGEILNIGTNNGIPFNGRIAVARDGEIVGYRAVPKDTSDGVIARYQQHFDRSSLLVKANEPERALVEIDDAIRAASTHRARFNRALILLSLGRAREGFDEYAACESTSDAFIRPACRAARAVGIEPWTGQDLRLKSIVLLHDHGFGDTIMCLRYIRRLYAMGASVIVQCPPELYSVVQQHAPTMRLLPHAKYYCSMFGLMQIFGMPNEKPQPYLKVDPKLVKKWREIIGPSKGRKRIGIAWSVGKPQDGDYPRSCPLAMFDHHLGGEAELISVQQFGMPEVAGGGLAFADFADCAALMSLMDEIVTVDTAAVHLAGAIGHPKITLLLSHWASWRWLSPLYGNIQICRQQSPGDWTSAFAQRGIATASMS